VSQGGGQDNERGQLMIAPSGHLCVGPLEEDGPKGERERDRSHAWARGEENHLFMCLLSYPSIAEAGAEPPGPNSDHTEEAHSTQRQRRAEIGGHAHTLKDGRRGREARNKQRPASARHTL